MALPNYSLEQRREIAKKIGIGEQYAYQISSGLKIPSAALARQWNRADPKAALWDLRPDDWYVIWPELMKRKGAPEVPDTAEVA